MMHWIEITSSPMLASFMHEPIFKFDFMGHPVVIVPWKLVGYFGVLMFGFRWFPQMMASRKAGRVRMPRVFWLMSVLGSISLLSYFIFGKNDSVGILSNLFPSFVAFYNLYLDLKNARKDREHG